MTEQQYPDPIQEFTASIAGLEYHLVASVVANVAPGIAISHTEGLDASMIGSDDLRTIYVAAEATADLNNTTATLCLAKRGLIHFGHWEGLGWHDERLVHFALEYFRQTPVVRECAQAIVRVHHAWAEAADEWGPMFIPPPALGALNPIRTGMILAKLSRLAGLPIEWVHYRFAQICWRQDAKITFEDSFRDRSIILPTKGVA